MKKEGRVSINVIVKDDSERILLVKKGEGLELPIYEVGDGETLENTCEKMIKKFIGVDISYPKSLFYFGKTYLGMENVDFYLKANCVSNFDISDEHKEYVWVNLDNISEHDIEQSEGLFKYLDEYH